MGHGRRPSLISAQGGRWDGPYAEIRATRGAPGSQGVAMSGLALRVQGTAEAT
jgi:hypothetical protein